MNRIIISRTDNIGDVVLTLPLAYYLKKVFPSVELIFLCKNYTHAILEYSSLFTEIWSFDELLKSSDDENIKKIIDSHSDVVIHVFPNKKVAAWMKKAKISLRIGTSHRFFHWFTCNKRVNFTRKKSDLHEAQLNFKLLLGLGINDIPDFKRLNELVEPFLGMVNSSKISIPSDIIGGIILHPKSNASAVEWPIKKYVELAEKLVENGEMVIFTGTEKEGNTFRHLIPNHSNCIDLTGKFTLNEFIFFISKQKALIACSTGPYHLAGLLGIRTVGLFSSRKPIHPGRWKALGKKSTTLVFDENCDKCKKGESCNCIEKISVNQVYDDLYS